MNTSLSPRIRFIQIFRNSERPTFLYAKQFALLHYIYFECSKRRMIFQRKFVQRRKYIFSNSMRERFVFLFFSFFSFITWKHLRFWTNERHRHKSQKGRRHMVSHRYGDVASIVYLHNTKAVPGSHRERHTYKHISQRWLNANGPLDNIYHHSLRNPLEEWLWSVRLDHVWKKQQNGKRTDNAEDIVLTIESDLATLREKIHESVTREKNYRRTLAMLLFLAKN